MAIKQPITNISGTTVEYHRIAEAKLDFTLRTATITVLSYLNVEKRDEEKEEASMPHAPRNILKSEYYFALPSDTDFTLEFAYGWLKENVYKEAEDC